MSLFQCSIWMKFLFWYKILFWYCVNWKRTLIGIRIIANCVVCGEWYMLSDLVRKPREWECLRLRLDFRHLSGSAFDPSWRGILLGEWVQAHFPEHWLVIVLTLGAASLFYQVNAAWTSFWNETHLGMNFTPVQCNQPWPLIWPLLCGYLLKENMVTL